MSEMNELKNELLLLLKRFDKICKENNIVYFLTGGCALGAVRHKGFIPWDDDIDVGMTLANYKKLVNVMENSGDDRFVLVDNDTYPHHNNPIAQYVDTATTRVTRASLTDECPKGVLIEIFIHTPVPESSLDEQRIQFLEYCELLSSYFSIIDSNYKYNKGLSSKISNIVANCYFDNKNSREEKLKVLQESVRKYTEEESDYFLLEWGIACKYYPKENFSGIRMLPFEDMEVPVTSCCCDTLRIAYGNNWMCFPENTETPPHVSIDNFDVSCFEFMDNVEKCINKKETREMRLKKKEIAIKSTQLSVDIDVERYNMEMKIHKSLETEENIKKIEKDFQAGKYSEIIDLFSDYIVFKKRTRNNREDIKEDLDIRTKNIIIDSLIMENRLTDAEYVAEVKRNGILHCDEFDTREQQILLLSKVYPSIIDLRLEDTKFYLDNINEKYKQSYTYFKLKMIYDVAKNDISKDALTIIDKKIKQYPDDYDLLKIKGDILYLKHKKKAFEIYDIVENNSRNGVDLLDIRKKREGFANDTETNTSIVD